MAPSKVVPLTVSAFTALTSPPMLASPARVKLLPAPARVLPVCGLVPVSVVSAPRVTAPV